MLTLFLSGLSGLIVGSFLCLAADRYQPSLTSRQWLVSLALPASHCAGCGHRLKLSDLVPIYSWCRRQGKCRYCQIKLPLRLLITEILTCLLFTLVASYHSSPAPLIFSLFLSAALIVLSLIDWQHFMLPDAITLPLLWLGLLYHLALSHEYLPSAVTGAVLGWLFLWLLYWGFQAWYRQEGVGYGDMKLFAALGAWCGWQALPLIAAIAALLGLSLFVYRGVDERAAGWHRRQPFGPCLSIAGWAVFIWQTQTGSVTPPL
ncbi:general secretion pathway protein GspO [Mixta theicola]|uniref:Prepilin leader peptidase/N-methyltransferase n=1 Tax=Mixta theicola TaxID=1458355 RepID=A0A2K1Q4L7_9GAMM|nr:A24 family peptidase [Mixta theicola]PNS09992.1 general secretion pathway protein GspO [Mixta theicola]